MWRAFGNLWNEEADEKRLCLKCQAVTGGSERRRCSECEQLKTAQAFGANWGAEETMRLCKQCSSQCVCAVCKQLRPRTAFRANQLTQKFNDRKCNACADLADLQNKRRATGAPCCHCFRMTFDPTWTCDKAYDVEKHRQVVMCAACEALGRTVRDGDVYACNLAGGCQRVLGRQFFAPKDVENFNARGGKLWCKGCIEKMKNDALGRTVRDRDVYACNLVGGCQRVLGRQFFASKDVEHFKDRGGKLWCKECTDKHKKEETQLEQQRALNEAERKGVHKGGVQCARPECAKEHFDPKWSQKDRENLRAGKKKSVCEACRNEGYTPGDVNTYICDGENCECKGGVQKFSEESIFRHKKAGRKGETLCVKCAKPKKPPKK